MNKKTTSLLIATMAILVLAACSSVKLPGTTSSNQQTGQQSQGQNQGQNFTNMPVEGKLAIGTLMLEGTDNAVTAEQAKQLLPLWKAVKSMSGSSNTSTQELNAVYKQIEDTMTTQQIQAIKDASMKPEDTQALMKKYNIQVQQRPTMDASTQATMQARRSSRSGQSGSSGGGFPGGDVPGGMPPDGNLPGGGMPSGQNAQGTPRAMGTPRAGGFGGGGGMNTLFVDPLITVLTDRAGV